MKFITTNDIFLLEEIVKRNFSSKYKDSVLGIFWSVLKPLLIMALFTILFSTIFSRNIENYPVYFLSGKCIYDFFAAGVGLSMFAIKGNSAILQRTPAPKYIFILGSIISEFFNFLITLGILVCVMIVTGATFYWSIVLLAIFPIISLLALITGLGFILSITCVYYSDIQHLWSVFVQMLMYASAVFFPMSIIPEPYHQYLILNPIYWIINQFRMIIYHGIIPNITYMCNSLLLSVIILLLGIIIYKKYEKTVTMKF